MQIKNSHGTETSFVVRHPWIAARRRLLIGGVAFAVVVVGLLLGAAVAQRSGLLAKLARLDFVQIAQNHADSYWAEPEHLTIDIKHKHFLKLADWRRIALRQGQISSDLKEYVPAVIRYADREIDVKLRLKGKWDDHVETPKWSFRIAVRGDDSLFGMKRFDVQHPRARGYLGEWLYRRALWREDVVAPRYEFVRVTVNGKDKGIYALDEAPSKQLIENSERREGVIVRFNADYRYKPFAGFYGTKTIVNNAGITSEHSSEIVPVRGKKTLEKPGLRSQFLTAHNLMQAFRDEKLPTHQVFDIRALANYFAISELFGTHKTSNDWSDMRFVYDPIASRLEPVGLEGASFGPIEHLLGAMYHTRGADPDRFHTLLFADEEFYTEYIRALERVSRPGYVDSLFEEIEEDLVEARRAIHKEWPHKDFDARLLARNAESIRDFLDPHKGIHAYLKRCSTESCEVEVGAAQAMPIEVLELVSGGVTLEPSGRVVLPGKPWYDRMRFETVGFAASAPMPEATDPPAKLSVVYRLLGTNRLRNVKVYPWPRHDESLLAADFLRRPANADTFPFVSVDETRRTITLAPGEWRVDSDLILPRGYTVQAGPGVTIDLADSASILSRSALDFRGDEEDPVVVTSTDGSGQGLLVINTEGRSNLRHVVLRNLRPPSEQGWGLTGAVTFYRSPVDLRDCEVVGNDAEDGLNIVRSEFTIEGCFFADLPSDAFDGDFADGRIANSTFARIAGDGIDLSGSQVRIEGVRASEVVDKGLSLGEGSQVDVANVRVSDVGIGVAVKDKSNVSIRNLSVSKARYGVAIFQKKPEFGPAQATLSSVAMVDVEEPYLVEAGSTVELDQNLVRGDRVEVAGLIYGP